MFKCVSCGEVKSDSEYYKAKNKRGLTSKCKVCVKAQVNLYREENIEKVMEYDRNRPNAEQRVAECSARYKQKILSGDLSFKEKDSARIRNYRHKNPLKYKAHCSVNNALRDGRIVRPDTCSCCQSTSKLQAHHWSYEEEHWLNVVWLCTRCHADEHNRLRELGRDPDQA